AARSIVVWVMAAGARTVIIDPVNQSAAAQYQGWRRARTSTVRQWVSRTVTGQGHGQPSGACAVTTMRTSAPSTEAGRPAHGQRIARRAAAQCTRVAAIAAAGCAP